MTTGGDAYTHTNPIFNRNKLKLGAFAFNGTAAVMTTLPEQYAVTWENCLDVALEADAAGFEALVPYARWRTLAAAQHRSGRVFENLTWTSAIAAKTNYTCVMTTAHVSLLHPIVLAKAASTIDHISNGRFALNIVCGWYKAETEMFGMTMMEHDERYDYAEEWLNVVKMLWTNDEFANFTGDYFKIKQAMSQPKPVQRPMPPLMNAGGSPRGQRYVAKNCDVAFIIPLGDDDAILKTQVDAYRELARSEFNREIQVWTNCYVVHAESRQDANRYIDYYAEEHGDDEFCDRFIGEIASNAKTMPPEILRSLRRAVKAGAGGVPLLGTPSDIAQRLTRLSEVGLDGVLLTWFDFNKGVREFTHTVLPLLERAGLRDPLCRPGRLGAA